MAAQAKASPSIDFEGVDPDRRYGVLLVKPIQVGKTWMRPGNPIEMKGAAIQRQGADVFSKIFEVSH